LHPERHLASGSTFKLYVLGAVAEHVRDSDASFDDLITVDTTRRAFPAPSGMATMAAGDTITVAETAALMISISDNMATDHLIDWVGRERVEAYMSRLHPEPALNLPFLRTIEMFRLKVGGDEALRTRYAEAGPDGRRAMLDEVNVLVPQLALAQFWSKPIEIDRIEWFMSPRAAATVMRDLRRLESIDGLAPVGDALRRNPGLDLGEGWASIAYKGGSEPGVLSMTWMLESDDGRWFTLSIGANSTEHLIDQDRFFTLAQWGVMLLKAHIANDR
ncbi:MAG: serine hydrolase, partial [Phycisphaerales bacterium]|nr:serine hydrolase [Phycisphaerales bacterium]